MGKAWEYLSCEQCQMGVRWTLEGRGHIQITYPTSLPPLSRTPVIHEIESTRLDWWETYSQVYCAQNLKLGTAPPYIHLASTSYDKCFQVFPIFRRSSASVHILYWMRKKKQGRLGKCHSIGKQKLKRCTKLGPPTLIPFTVQFLLVLPPTVYLLNITNIVAPSEVIWEDTLLSPDNALLSLTKPDSHTKNWLAQK